jgi:hypothetical protein
MARSFNGTSDFIKYGTLPLPASMTLAVWTRWTGASAYGTALWLGASGNTNASIYVKSTGKLAVYYNSGSSSYDGTGTNTLVSGTWYHLAATFPSGVLPNGYVNGALDGTGNANFTSNAQGLTQSGNDLGTNWFGGSLADAAVWNVALAQAELTALANGVRPYQIRPQSLIGFWPLDGYGHPALDRSRGKNNGVLTGTAFATGPPLLNPAPIILPLPDPSFVMPAMPSPPPPQFILMPQIVT